MTGALCGFQRCQRRLIWIKRRLVGLQVKRSSILDSLTSSGQASLIAIDWLQR
jgi:hypothetical protein